MIRVEVLFLPLRFSFVGMGKFWSCAFTKNEQWAGAHICAGFALGCALDCALVFTLVCALGFTLCSHRKEMHTILKLDFAFDSS